MKHILGMAKSYLNLKGSKPRNLELDFVHLAFAVSKTRELRHEAYGVLLVLREEPWKRAEGWKKKYGITNEVEVVLAHTTPDEDRILKTEKTKNAKGNQRGAKRKDASASKSEKIGEGHLRAEVMRRFPNVVEMVSDLPHLATVRWDFCGAVNNDRGGVA